MRLAFDSVDAFSESIKMIKKTKYFFGAGTYGKIFGQFFDQKKIEWNGYIDNSEMLIGSTINEKKVYSLEFFEDNKDIIVIIAVLPLFAGTLCEQIRNQLLDFGIPEKNIIRLSENKSITQQILYWSKQPQDSFDKFKKLKNKYENRRCFLIGNGPSLKMEDLEKLSNDVSVGCNGLIQLFTKCGWKPTCFYFADPTFIRQYVYNENKVKEITDNCEIAITTISNYIYDEFRNKIDNLYFAYINYDKSGMWFEEDVTRGVCPGGTSLYVLLQLIVYMGIKEIYLLGVDFNFKRVICADGSEVVNTSVIDHAEGIDQIKEAKYEIDTIRAAWLCAKEYADSHGIKIYNATRGGKLEVFERVDFDSLFE